MSRVRGWRRLAALHDRIEDHIERALQRAHGLSVNEYCVLHLLSEQDQSGKHYRMQQVSEAVVLSQSATTRLVNRLEDRGLLSRYLCPDDRRGIYADVTDAGRELHDDARPTHDEALENALQEAAKDPQYAALVDSLETLS